jgi:hypothetical protein
MIQKGIYKHYKGNTYRVIGVGKHSETLEDLVVYQGLYQSEEFGNNPLWIRPKKLFEEYVTINGKKMPRFQFLYK